MRLSLVLAHEYCPYWKWLAAEFRKLSEVGKLDQWLRQLAATLDIDAQADLVRMICAELHSGLVSQFGLDPNPTGHPHPLLCAHRELRSQAPEVARVE